MAFGIELTYPIFALTIIMTVTALCSRLACALFWQTVNALYPLLPSSTRRVTASPPVLYPQSDSHDWFRVDKRVIESEDSVLLHWLQNKIERALVLGMW